jgi:guanine deaminase
MSFRNRVLQASFFHAPAPGVTEAFEGALLEIDGNGIIAAVIAAADPRFAGARAAAARSGDLITLPPGCWLLPGFVDLHIHAPQYPQLGAALDVPLETWLHKYTFPLEARYANLDFAARAYGQLIDDLAANGTTTAVMFATIHEAATRLLAGLAMDKGIRAYVGKVVMDDPAACPSYYRDVSAAQAEAETRALIAFIRGDPRNSEGRVKPVITPRFIPSCSDDALARLGALARETHCHVQTHCSESDWEHGFVLTRHGRSDTESLDSFGLLTRRTVLAHSNHVSAADMDLIKARGAGIAHCPLSNAYFANAVFPLRAALEKGLRVGLGSDIAGGPSASIFDGMRMAVAASRMLEDGVDARKPRGERGSAAPARVSWREAFYLATAGGADVLEQNSGRFAAGQSFDAIVIDTAAEAGTVRLIEADLVPDEILARILYTASKPNIARTIVAGETVYHRSDDFDAAVNGKSGPQE